MSVVDEAADLRPIHSLPHRRNGVVLGVANVRGELLVCVSLEHLLGIEAQPHAIATIRNQRLVHRRLLVLRHAGGRLAFPVDEAHGAERYDAAALKPVPSTVAKAAARYSKAMLAWRDQAVGLLDDELLFHSLDRSLG
jgi:chemotaxis-related protein WspD